VIDGLKCSNKTYIFIISFIWYNRSILSIPNFNTDKRPVCGCRLLSQNGREKNSILSLKVSNR